MAIKRGGLGTNLDSLIPTSLTVAGTEVAQQNEIPLSQISPNPKQPRQIFDEAAMAELVASIKSVGITTMTKLCQIILSMSSGYYISLCNAKNPPTQKTETHSDQFPHPPNFQMGPIHLHLY